jgi:predicted NBD/HSP70 family sugar kinase
MPLDAEKPLKTPSNPRGLSGALRGSNHTGLRQFNERIVLQSIRQHGPIAKADLARLTDLSGQAVSVIVDKLFDDGLLKKQARTRGKIGQPSIPLSLDADGAFGVGLHVGRRSLEAVVCDFVGHIRYRKRYLYAYPDPELLLPVIQKALSALPAKMGDHWSRTAGIGLAAPLFMHQWGDLLGSQANLAMQAWDGMDLPAAVQAMSPLPMFFAKDTTAACVAELLHGHGRVQRDFLYVFVGTFVGGGLVMGGQIVRGATGNAGAIGSMPLTTSASALGEQSAAPQQLLHLASGWQLEQALAQGGLSPDLAQDASIMKAAHDRYTQPWLTQTSQALAMTVASATALVDLGAVVIDGSLDGGLMAALVQQTQAQLAGYAFKGMLQPRVLKGEVGAHARALGGALLPLRAQFFPDQATA